MAMTPRMAKMWLEAQKAEGIDVDSQKIDALNAGIEGLCKQVKVRSVPITPRTKDVTYVKTCPICCRLLTARANYCDGCGQAVSSASN